MKLTDEQKKYLKELKESAGYRVLMLIENDARASLSELLFKSDFSNPENIKVLERNQVYQKARDDLFKNIDSHTREVFTPSAE